MAKLNATQRGFLINKINNLYGYTVQLKAAESTRLADTPAVKAARKLVSNFDKANEERVRAILKLHTDKADEARGRINFMDADVALAYVDKLQPIPVTKKVSKK